MVEVASSNLAGPTKFPNRWFYFISIFSSAQLLSECLGIEISYLLFSIRLP